MTKRYFRPLAQTGPARPAGAAALAGTCAWFTHAEVLSRGEAAEVVPVDALPDEVRTRLSGARQSLAGLSLDRMRIMGVVNVTPDSFSDGGRYLDAAAAISHGKALAEAGADILDIGGESTRPGAAFVPEEEEIARVLPVIAGLSGCRISVDTRKAKVALAAAGAGAAMLNDVSALTFDPEMADVAAQSGLPICLMHAQGDPATMQADPQYGDVLLDVYDHLETQITVAESAGIARDRILVDPGIGFGKTLEHNLILLKRLTVFHGLGCALLLGVSRKRFIGTVGQEPAADRRMPGSLAVGLEGARAGVHVLRVHDVAETVQGVALWQALNHGDERAGACAEGQDR